MVCLRCGRGEATQAREEEMCLAGWLVARAASAVGKLPVGGAALTRVL